MNSKSITFCHFQLSPDSICFPLAALEGFDLLEERFSDISWAATKRSCWTIHYFICYDLANLQRLISILNYHSKDIFVQNQGLSSRFSKTTILHWSKNESKVPVCLFFRLTDCIRLGDVYQMLWAPHRNKIRFAIGQSQCVVNDSIQ